MHRTFLAGIAGLALIGGAVFAQSYEPGVVVEPDAAQDVDEAIIGNAEFGADSYAADCARCHASIPRLMRSVPGDDDEARAAWLDEFLEEHFAPDPQTRADIIAHMLAQ